MRAIASDGKSFYLMGMIRLRLMLLALAVVLFALSPAFAAEKAKAKTTATAPAKTSPQKQAEKPAAPKAENLGKFGFWSAYVIYEGRNPVCYMSLSARTPEAGKTRREAANLMVTHRPAESSTDVISYAPGFKYKQGSDVTLQIGDKSFSLFTQDSTAWARDAATDKAIAAAMRGGADHMTVSGTAATGKNFGDTIPLKGTADAYYAASKACGLSAEKPKAAKESPKAGKKEQTVKKPSAPKKENTAKPKAPDKPKAPSAHKQ